MRVQVQTLEVETEVTISVMPDKCPICHQGITPKYINGFLDYDILYLGFNCIKNNCSRYFITQYYRDFRNDYHIDRDIISSPNADIHPEVISTISPNFVTIYGQAQIAQESGLSQICGMGFRKAFEFLVKDYLVTKNPTREDEIKSKFLGVCISEMIENTKIKDIASRAAWLGNDETHYVRIWAGLDVESLKQLIKLTTYWIEAEHLTDQMIASMPR